MQMLRSTALAAVLVGVSAWTASAVTQPPTEGMLHATGPQGEELGACPLEHTDVQVRITGFVARVDVTQAFHNPFEYKIEGIYVFPMSQNAAVDDMTMTVGDRVIRGVIKPREEARQIYEEARASGHVASLLDQERPNIFTQSVANIEPGERVEIRISYVETLDWEDGTYQFDFPMVVGPRYIPGGGSAEAPMLTGRPTPEVPDADRITPPVIPEGMRAGHDISVSVEITAGFPIRQLVSAQHEIDVAYHSAHRSEASISLQSGTAIPNKDFVLRYKTSTDEIGDTVLTHFDHRGGYLTMVLQPPQRVRPEWIVPKEMIFVIDKSGSMSGFPIETAKRTMRMCIENLNPDDTFNLMTFAGGVGFCFDKPVANTAGNRSKALEYLKSLQGGGGTEMMKAIRACLGGRPDPERVRVVCFMTDGYVGNDMAIIDAVKKNAAETRVFSFGIGRSVNRYLLDGLAGAGRGDVEYVLSEAECSESAERFYERVSTPVLTDIEIDWGDLVVDEIYPKLIPDLFSAKPVVIKARYSEPASGIVTLIGKRGSKYFEREMVVNLPGTFGQNEVIASLWARAKVADLMDGDLTGIQQGRPDPVIKESIVKLGMEYRLLSQFTSFVAVEEMTVTRGGEPTKVQVPVEMPDGVSYEGVFGERSGGIALGSAGFLMRRQVGQAGLRGKMKGQTMNVVYGGAPVNGSTPSSSPNGASLKEAKIESLDLGIDLKDDDEANWTDDQRRDRALQGKLAPELRGLAARVGDRPDFTEGDIKVVDGRIEVTVYLLDTTDATLDELKALGFRLMGRSKAAKMVIGSIELSKLEALALLDDVRSVQLATFK